MAAIPLREVGFGSDNFENVKILDPLESLGKIIYRIFVMKPGTLPSMPTVGVDIRKYLYKHENAIDYDELRNKIFTNCSDLMSFMNVGDVIVDSVKVKNVHTLVVVIKATISREEYAMIVALRKGNDNDVLYSFKSESLKVAS